MPKLNCVLIRNGQILTMDAQDTIIDFGWVFIQGGKIDTVKSGEPPQSYVKMANRIIDAHGMLVFPGFVNSHSHLCQTFMRNVADNYNYADWLGVVENIRGSMTPQDVYYSTLIALVENMRSGVTSVVNHHKVSKTPEHVSAAVDAANASGMRMCFMRGVGDNGRSEGERAHTSMVETWRMIKACVKDEGRISIGIGPTALFRCTKNALTAFSSFSKEMNIPLHIHIAEDADELKMSKRVHGSSSFNILHESGGLNQKTQLVHCIHISDEDVDLIKSCGSNVVHCPVSNMYLGSGIAPIKKLLNQGVHVGIGTDGTASSGRQDMFDAMKTAALLSKIRSNAKEMLTPYDIVRMATKSGEVFIGQSPVGQISPGYKADITIVNLKNVYTIPPVDPYSALVYSCNVLNVQTVIVGGDVCFDNGVVRVLDEFKLCEEALVVSMDLLKRAGFMKEKTWNQKYHETYLS